MNSLLASCDFVTMRIIAGTYRTRTINAPAGRVTRPTTDRARESMFNLISSRLDLENARVLDLYCGSGSLGLEALSRGAGLVRFVDLEPRAIAAAEENAATLDRDLPCSFELRDAFDVLRRTDEHAYDLVLADPPYTMKEVVLLPEAVKHVVSPGGLFVLEHDRHMAFADHPDCETSRRYGRTNVSVFMYGYES